MTLISSLPQRQPSRAARWSLRLAMLTPALAVIAIAAHRGGMIDTPAFLSLVVMVGALCALTVVLILGGLRSLWVHGKKGGQRLSWAMLLVLPLIVPFASAAYLAATNPMGADTSTDPANPPLFAAELGAEPAPGVTDTPDADRRLSGQRFSAPLDTLLGAVQGVAATRGWSETGRRGRVGADDAVFVEYRHNSPILHMPVEIVVRLVDEGDSSYVDMRARMLHVRHDLGSMAHLIERAMADIDFAMIGLTET